MKRNRSLRAKKKKKKQQFIEFGKVKPSPSDVSGTGSGLVKPVHNCHIRKRKLYFTSK